MWVEKVENIVGKEENADYQHFLLFQQCFQKASFSGSKKVRIVWFQYQQTNKPNSKDL